MVELDLQFTSDGKLAVFHDVDLRKKFGRPEKCREITAETFQSLRRTEDPACPGYLLEDFFRCGVAPILLHHSHTTVEAALDLVEEYGYRDKVLFGIGEVRTLITIRERFPEAKVLGFIRDPEDIEAFGEHGVNFIRLWERWLNPENVRRVKESGAELWIMTGGAETNYRVGRPDEEALKRLMTFEPDGLLVNDIPFVKSVLATL